MELLVIGLLVISLLLVIGGTLLTVFSPKGGKAKLEPQNEIEEDVAQEVGDRARAAPRGGTGRMRLRARGRQVAAEAPRAGGAGDAAGREGGERGDDEDSGEEGGEGEAPGGGGARNRRDQKKAARAAKQAAEVEAREARAEKSAKYSDKQREREQAREAEEALKAEEQREEEAKREAEGLAELEQWKGMFSVETEGTVEADVQQESQGLLLDFVHYIQKHKCVVLEELAAEFELRTQDVVNRVVALEQMGRISGVMDDRGKFIYISPEEMQAVADYIRRSGRVSIAHLASKSNEFIDLEPKKVEVELELEALEVGEPWSGGDPNDQGQPIAVT
eukprot:jgi/Mesen1/4596/ME000232S03847